MECVPRDKVNSRKLEPGPENLSLSGKTNMFFAWFLTLEAKQKNTDVIFLLFFLSVKQVLKSTSIPYFSLHLTLFTSGVWVVPVYPVKLRPGASSALPTSMSWCKMGGKVHASIQFLNADGPQLMMIQLTIFRRCESHTHSGFYFGSFLGSMICGLVLSPAAGHWQPPVSHVVTDINSPDTDNLLSPHNPSIFSLSIGYMKQWTLCYKIGFLFDNFAQL